MKLLKILLVLSGLVQVLYWGASHILFPAWYLGSVGLAALAAAPGTTVVFLNEIGVLSVGLGLATMLAARDPVRNFAVIAGAVVAGAGSAAVSAVRMADGTMPPGEWITVAIIGAQLLLLAALFPWWALGRADRVGRRG